MTDHWGWVEEDEGLVLRETIGYVKGRRQFPPQPQRPGVRFIKYDPITATLLTGPGEFAELFEDYNVWAGWNREKSMTVVGLTYDTTFESTPSSHIPWFARVDTTSEDLTDWVADLGDIYLIPADLQVRSQLRFIPGTNNCSFLATNTAYPQPHIFRLDTSSMTVDVVATPVPPTIQIYSYCWSYDGGQLAINAPWVDAPTVRVFSRDGDGDTIAQISPDDVFGFNVAGLGYTDNSRYMYAWDGGHHVVHDALGSFGPQWIYPMEVVGAGLFGDATYSITLAIPDPTHSYWFRSGAIALGLGGSNTMSQFLTWDGEEIFRGGGGYGGLHGDWSQDGGLIVLTDGGRDPYGGQFGLTKVPSFTGGGGGEQQEVGDPRIRPFHGLY
jgi:hypothetical protein